MSTEETLRTAAVTLRDATGATLPGPWRDAGRYGGLIAPNAYADASPIELEGYGGALVAESMSSGTTRYLTLVNPAVAGALADWLSAEAERMRQTPQRDVDVDALRVAQAILDAAEVQ